MSIKTLLGLTGVSLLLGACGGTTVLADDPGAAGKGGGDGVAGGGPSAGAPTVAGAGGGTPGGAGGGTPVQALEDVDGQKQSDKLDVLFVVDNSVSMADKQGVLARSLPAFISRLVNPPCVDSKGAPVAVQPLSGAAECSSGVRQFAPVKDMHLAAITTSLGGHGGTVCANTQLGTNVDDQAELLALKREGAASYKGSGFLSWDSAGTTGIADSGALTGQLSSLISAAGQTGCGYEATLESMYRFLIDPEPPVSVEKVSGTSTRQGLNEQLLAQRAAFLRPDSSVAIVILSDENDCSIIDEGAGWFVSGTDRMPRSTSVCEENPNDACCRSCAKLEPVTPAGCTAIEDDAACKDVAPGKTYAEYDRLHDSLNLRCFNQQKRFGFDLLNPLSRYSTGLTNTQVYDSNQQLVPNPLFAAREGKGPRSNSLVSVSFIVGAPWQDLATDDSMTSGNLTYLNAAGLTSKKRWPMLLGDPASNVPPSDPLMTESIEERSGKSPVTNQPIVPATSVDPLANPGNGHEHSVPDMSDLQYACTFQLANPVACQPADPNCDCAPNKSGDTSYLEAENSPLCQPPQGGAASTTQYFAKGYPGTRQLTLARDLGERAAAASICPKVTDETSGANYGYVPALNALVDRLAVTLK